MFLKKISIGKQLGLSFLLIILFFIASLIITFMNLSEAKDKANYINNNGLPHSLLANEMIANVGKVHKWLIDVAATRDPDGMKEAEYFSRKFKLNIKELKKIFEAEKNSSAAAMIDKLNQLFDSFFAKGNKMANTYLKEGQEAGNTAMNEFDAQLDKMTMLGKTFQENKVNELKGLSQNIQKLISSVLIILSAIGLATILVSIIIAFLISRNIIVGFKAIKSSTEEIVSNSKEVSHSAQSVSQGTNQQASATEEITSAIVQLASQSKNAATNSQKVKDLSQSALSNAKEGKDNMKKMISAINEISLSSAKVAKIIKTIDEIAFQTNLLALNAAVEAARAGMHGKGFAVVAEEVNNLSKRSSLAAKETGEIIEETLLKVKEGMEITVLTENSFSNIYSAVTDVSKLTEEIFVAGEEQVRGIEQVETGIQQIDTVTQQNASVAEENAASSESLMNQAEIMRNVIKQFLGTSNGLNKKVPGKKALVIEHNEMDMGAWKNFDDRKKIQIGAPRGKIVKPDNVINLRY